MLRIFGEGGSRPKSKKEPGTVLWLVNASIAGGVGSTSEMISQLLAKDQLQMVKAQQASKACNKRV